MSREIRIQEPEVRRQKAKAGFTLVELLAVITIIGILAGLIIGASKYAATKSKRSSAAAQIAGLEAALEDFKADYGYYPHSTGVRSDAVNNCTNLYTALAAGPQHSKTYFPFKPNQLRAISSTATNIIDPFGMPYNYYCNSGAADQTNRVTFDLWSYGPDRLNDTADDIANWKANN